MDFYLDNNEDIPQHIGFCHILPSNLKESVGSITVPITSVKQEPLGQITSKYANCRFKSRTLPPMMFIYITV